MKRKERKKKVKKKFFRKFLKVVGLTLSTIFLIGCIGVGYLVVKYEPMAKDIWNSANEKIASINEGTFKNKTETVIYDNDGKVIKELAIHDYEYIDYPDIKQDIKDAVIAIEDVRYLEHDGYDVKAMGRAFVDIVRNNGEITQGGSTITQQLVKLQFLTLDKVYSRKIEEIIIATQLEKKYKKEEILEFYLNNINYGNGAYGIETASKTYFNKHSSELTLSEVALLTAIPNNPTLFNPVRNMDNALVRRDIILKEMLDYNFITNEEYETAITEKIVLNMPKKEYEPEGYEVSYAVSSATKLLMKNKGFQFKYWFDTEAEQKKYQIEYNEMFTEISQQIRNGGFEIYTTIDSQAQKQLQDSINNELALNRAKDRKSGLYKLQASGAVIDNLTGDLIAIVGGRTQDTIANTYNRAFLSYRQPGSVIKPILVYAPAFERDKLPTSIMNDFHKKNGPANATNTFAGNISLRKAIETSVNTIPFQIINQYGADEVIPYLTDLEFAGLVPQDSNPIISIGGFTKGTNVLEMTGAFATLANNGSYVKPTGISKIVDVSNQVLYENKHKKKQVFDSGSAYLTTDTLKGVMTSGTAKGYALKGMTSAGKTGTTNNYKDIWMAGYTPYYSSVIWVGYDTPQRIQDTSYAKEIWYSFMTKIHKGLKDKDFIKPSTISYMYVNPKTGEIDKEDSHGWWKLQLVPEIQWEYQERKREESRIKAEANAREKERQRKEKIKQALDEAGISESEEERRELYAELQLETLSNSHIYSQSDVEYVYNLMNETLSAIEEIVLSEPKAKAKAKYYKQVNRISNEEYQMKNPVLEVEEEPVQEPIIEVFDNPKVEDNSKVNETSPPVEKPVTNNNSNQPIKDTVNEEKKPVNKTPEESNSTVIETNPPTEPSKEGTPVEEKPVEPNKNSTGGSSF